MTLETLSIPFMFVISDIIPQFIAFIVVLALLGSIIYNILE